MFEPVNHHVLTFQRLDQHAVLDCLLKSALHPRVFRAHIFRQLTHLTDVDLTHRHEDRDNSYRGQWTTKDPLQRDSRKRQ